MRSPAHPAKQRTRRAILAFVAAFACATPAAAQDVAMAETLFRRGVEHLRAGRYEQACAAITESQRLDPQAGTLFTLAQCEAKRGRIATAIARYHDYLALVPAMMMSKRTAHLKRERIARAEVAALGPLVPELTIALRPKAPPGSVVKRDGVVLSAAMLGVPLPIDPGQHVVSVKVPGGPWTETRLSMAQGEKRSLVVEGKPPAPPPPASAPPGTGTSGQRVAAYVTAGVGAASLVVGGVMGGLTLAKRATIHANCGVDGVKTKCRNQQGADAGNSAQTTALVSTIGFGVGLAALGTALVLRLAEPKRAKAPAGPAGPARRSATALPGVLSASDTGAVLGIRGSWQ